MSSRWIQTFEGRIAWYTIISLAATGIVEVVMAFLIYKVAGKLRYMGYRSAMLGPDGLYPGYRLMILGVCGALTFLFTFYALIHKYMSYVRMLERAMRDIANGNLDQEIPIENYVADIYRDGERTGIGTYQKRSGDKCGSRSAYTADIGDRLSGLGEEQT